MKPQRVLVVDDEAFIRFMLKKMLDDDRREVLLAESLTDAKQQLKQSDSLEYILLDLNLPDGSGYDLISDIEQYAPTAKTIIVSAYDSETERQKALKYGVSGFIGKPFSKEKVLATLTGQL